MMTTITAKKAVKKKTVLIDCSLSRENRAVPGGCDQGTTTLVSGFSRSFPPKNF